MSMRGVTTRVSAGRHMVAVAAVVGLAGLVSGCQSDASADPAAAAEEVRAVELDRLQSLIDADRPALEAVHAEDFRLIPPPGFAMNRTEYLDAVEAGEIDYEVFEPISEIDVAMFDDAAVLTYQSRIRISAAGQGEFDHEAWHTYLYERSDAGWQLVWEQATAVGGFPPP